MDKKISIRLREEKYKEIMKCAEEQRKSVSELVHYVIRFAYLLYQGFWNLEVEKTLVQYSGHY